jgi:hypothetical protein
MYKQQSSPQQPKQMGCGLDRSYSTSMTTPQEMLDHCHTGRNRGASNAKPMSSSSFPFATSLADLGLDDNDAECFDLDAISVGDETSSLSLDSREDPFVATTKGHALEKVLPSPEINTPNQSPIYATRFSFEFETSFFWPQDGEMPEERDFGRHKDASEEETILGDDDDLSSLSSTSTLDSIRMYNQALILNQ